MVTLSRGEGHIGKAKKAEQPSSNKKWLSEVEFCSIKYIAAI